MSELPDELHFLNPHPDKAYVGRQLWLPKRHIRPNQVKAPLEFWSAGMEQELVRMWEETEHHLIVPREFLNPEHYSKWPFPFVEVSPTFYPRANFRSNIKPRDDVQHEAMQAMLKSPGGILNLSCVAGDTELSLNRGGKGFKMEIATAYERTKGGRYAWDPNIPTFIRSKMGDRIGLNEVETILYKGKRQTWMLMLENGMALWLTSDHEVLTERGYIPLLQLTPGDYVITDENIKESIRKPKPVYRRLSWPPTHPFSRHEPGDGRKHHVIEEHRVVAEASMNGMSLDEYRQRFRDGDIEGLQFIDPSKYHVHHADENIKNNSPDNLEVLEKEAHLSGHRPGAGAFGYGIPTPVRVEAIEGHRIEDVYDVVCKGPYRNFQANGIIVHNCGKGKTVIALWLAAQLQVPFLVVVNNTSLIHQWEERIREHLQFTGKIGRIQQDTFNWEQPCALAMIHTLAFNADTWPAEFQRHWGLVFYDEIHHLAAPLFSRTAPLFYGRRYGLTATPFREDGRERVYYFHVGRVFYSDLKQDLEPRVYFVRIPTDMDLNDPEVVEEVTDVTGEVHLSKLRVWMGKQEKRNDIIAEHLRKMLRAGRKVLALTHSVDQLDRMRMRFPDSSAVIWSGVNQDERMDILRNNQIVFATSQLAYEGLDEPDLDSLVLMTPFGSANWIQQSIGRVQRARDGKKQPVVSIFEDYHITKCVSVCLKAKRSLRKLGMDYRIVR